MCCIYKLNLQNILHLSWCSVHIWYLKCCFNSGLLMTPFKPIINKSNLLSPCPWPSWSQFSREAHWPNYCLTDWLTQWLPFPFYIDCPLWRLYDLVVDRFLFCVFVMVISDWFWMAVCLLSDLIPAFSLTIVIVLDFLELKIVISPLSGGVDSLIEIIYGLVWWFKCSDDFSDCRAFGPTSDFNPVATLKNSQWIT